MSYREIVEASTRKTQYAKIAPPCSEREIEQTEAYVGYSFPEPLKNLLRELNGDGWFLLSAEQICENVRLNREILREAFDDEKEFAERVGQYILFATNGCGDYYGYHVQENGTVDESALYIWEHETFESKIVARDIPELIRKYYNDEI